MAEVGGKRWDSSENICVQKKDELDWKHYLERWQRDNNQWKWKDFTIYADELSKFSQGARNAGYKVSVVQTKAVTVTKQVGPSRVKEEAKLSLVEVTFP